MSQQENQTTEDKPQQSTELVDVRSFRIPWDKRVEEKYGVDPGQWRVLIEAIFPNAESFEAITMALQYCKARKLDILKRPVHIVPMWNSKLGKNIETVWPSISEIRTTASRTSDYAGKDSPKFGEEISDTFSGEVWVGQGKKEKRNVSLKFPEWCEITVYRTVHGVRCPFTERVYWKEAYGSLGGSNIPNKMWEKRTIGQLIKCAEAGALRAAFPEEIGNVYAAEEMEGKIIDITAETKTDETKPDAPERPAPGNYDDEQTFTILDEFGETVGRGDCAYFMGQITANIERFVAAHDLKMLKAFWEFNAETIESLGAKTPDRQEISQAYNDARNQLDDAPKSKEPIPTEEWEIKWDELDEGIQLSASSDDFEKFLAENALVFADMLIQEPTLHASLAKNIEAKRKSFDEQT